MANQYEDDLARRAYNRKEFKLDILKIINFFKSRKLTNLITRSKAYWERKRIDQFYDT